MHIVLLQKPLFKRKKNRWKQWQRAGFFGSQRSRKRSIKSNEEEGGFEELLLAGLI